MCSIVLDDMVEALYKVFSYTTSTVVCHPIYLHTCSSWNVGILGIATIRKYHTHAFVRCTSLYLLIIGGGFSPSEMHSLLGSNHSRNVKKQLLVVKLS